MKYRVYTDEFDVIKYELKEIDLKPDIQCNAILDISIILLSIILWSVLGLSVCIGILCKILDKILV